MFTQRFLHTDVKENNTKIPLKMRKLRYFQAFPRVKPVFFPCKVIATFDFFTPDKE